MFGGRKHTPDFLRKYNLNLTASCVAQEHLSEKEISEGEKKALVEVQIFTAACAALWFCTSTTTRHKRMASAHHTIRRLRLEKAEGMR